MNNDQPVKISRIELLENKLNDNISPSEGRPTEPTNQQMEYSDLCQPALSLSATTTTTTKSSETENHETKQSSIVTADYIQQSKKIIAG